MLRPPARLAFRLLLLSLLLAVRPAAAEEASTDLWDAPAFSLTAEELLAAVDAVPAGEEGVEVRILLNEDVVRFEDDGRQVRTHRLLYKVQNAAGVENWSETSRVWSPWYQERPTLRARVVAPDGTERWLDPATIGERPLGDATDNVLSDRLVVEAPLPAVTPGSVVEELVETRDTQPLFARGTVGRTYFAWSGIAVDRTRLVLDAPESLPVRYVGQLLDGLEPERTLAGGRAVLTFEDGPREGVEEFEELAPGTVPIWPQVIYSTGESWAAVARHYGELVEDQLADMDLEEVVGEALGKAQGREERIGRLLAWLHEQVRYTGVEFAEAAIVPRTPRETLARGYGDCKDKATLLVALLRSAGIPADVALLSTGPGPDVSPELPGLGDFDHAIVHVPGDPELWIDPTDEFARVGELPTADEGRLALIVNPRTEALAPTPESGPGENRFVETREVFLAADLGGARIVETTRYWGAFERAQRASLSVADPEDLEEGFDEYMKSSYGAEELVAWEHSDPKNLSAPFELRLEAKEASVAVTDLEYAVVYAAPDSLLIELPDLLLETDDEEDAGDESITAPSRQADLVLPVPYRGEHRYRIVPPDGYRAVYLPEGEERRLGPATLQREVAEEDDGTVLLTFCFDTGKRRLPPEEIEALREGAKELFDEDALQVEFEQVAEAHLAAGEIPEALAELDRLIEASPERALPRTRRARVLLKGGLGAAARHEAEAAVELEPELYMAHQTLGLVLLHDLVGRGFRKGMDQARAVAEFRKAVELEPDDQVDRQNLAVAFSRDEEGVPYGPGAPLDEAIEAHAALCDDPEANLCLEEDLLLLLARTGRFDEMLKRAGKPGRDTDAMTLVAEAAARGPAAALRRSRQIRDAAQLQAALAKAGQVLMQLEMFPESAEMFAAAAKGADDPAKVLGLVRILKKARPLEELELSADDPSGVVVAAMTALVAGDGDAVRALTTEASRERLEKGFVADFEEKMKAVRRATLRQTGMSLQGIFELGLAGAELKVEGDDEVGYRVRMLGRIAGVGANTVFFVVLEDGAYRVASDDELPNLGFEVLRRLEAGELAAARQWLDWACDLTWAPSAKDPYAGQPFFRFWKAGRQGSAEEIRAAAASLLAAGDDSAETAIPLLLEGRAAVAPEEQLRFDLALAQAYSRTDRSEELGVLARRWLGENPESDSALLFLRSALVEQENWDELEAAAQKRLEILPDDPMALHLLIGVATERNDLAERRRLYQRLLDLGKATGGDQNNLAWMDVVEGKVTEHTVELAQQAVDRDKSRAALHTLATAYAELGRSAEAREVVLQAMTVGDDDEPRSYDWYVWGRVAESYGLPEFAAEAYGKVEPPEDPGDLPSSTYTLAQRRLKALTSSKPDAVAEVKDATTG